MRDYKKQYLLLVALLMLTSTGCDFIKNKLGSSKEVPTASKEVISDDDSDIGIDYSDEEPNKIKGNKNDPCNLSNTELSSKIKVLRKVYSAAKKDYKQADGEDKLRLKKEVRRLKKAGRSVALEIKKRKKDKKGKINTYCKGKIAELRAELKLKEQAFKDINDWKTKVGKMSRIASDNTCAWCGNNYGRKSGRGVKCGCGKTAILSVGDDGISDVDREISSIHKKIKLQKYEIKLLKIKINSYKTKIKS